MELESFKENHVRGKLLEFAYKKMLEIRVSTVDIERQFSASGYIIKKFRIKLSDSTLDDIMFLKGYLENFELYKTEFPDSKSFLTKFLLLFTFF